MKLIFLFLCLTVAVLFNAIPYDSELLSMFIFSEYKLPFKTWLYFLCEHIVLIMLSYVIAHEEIKYKLACKVFFWLQVVNLFDYILTYNTNWIGFINFNIVALLIFSTSIVYEYGRGNI